MTENNQTKKEKYSHVIVRSRNEAKKVKISSALKPKITTAVLKKWQSLLDNKENHYSENYAELLKQVK